MQSHRPAGGLLVLDGLLSANEIGLLASISAGLIFEPQDLGRGVIAARYRAVTDDQRIPNLLWRVVSPELPPLAAFYDDGPGAPRLDPPVTEWTATGCNPRTRFYRYGPGAQFSEHEDEPWRPDDRTRSLLTLLVYLDELCEGGETVVHGEVIAPIPGRVALFDHGLLHQGQPVTRGTKLVVRSDVVARVGVT